MTKLQEIKQYLEEYDFWSLGGASLEDDMKWLISRVEELEAELQQVETHSYDMFRGWYD